MAFGNAQQRLPEIFTKMIEVNKAMAKARVSCGNVIHVNFDELIELNAKKNYTRRDCIAFIQSQRGGNTA